MGSEQSKPSTSIYLNIDRNQQVHRRDRSSEIFANILMFVIFSFICIYSLSIFTNLVDLYIYSPILWSYLKIYNYIAPYIFLAKCSYEGFFTWDQCKIASYNYPFEFIQQCHYLNLNNQQCWSLFSKLDWDFLKTCFNGFSQTSHCVHLLKNLVLS